jgi:DNA-binding NtrC family response regulator
MDGLRVFLLTRDEELRHLRHRVLEMEGMAVCSTSDSDAARQALSRDKYDVLIVCSLMAPAATEELMNIFHRENPNGGVVGIIRSLYQPLEMPTDVVVHGIDGPGALIQAVLEAGRRV